jgi:membrane protease YdiL (CAAX protease family)
MAVLLPVLAAGGGIYLSTHSIAWEEAGPALAALILEAAMFLSMGNAAARRWWRPWSMAVSVAVPALLVGAHPLVLAVAEVMAFWFVVLPASRWTDALYALLYGAITLGKLSEHLYPAPLAKLPLAILGELAWARILIWAVLEVRGLGGVGFGFLPCWRLVGIGLRWYALFLPVGAAVGWAIGFTGLRQGPWIWEKLLLNALGTFFGIYIFVALRENFLFRGMLLPWFAEWMGSWRGAQVGVALLCGAAHLPFRQFPNWRFALLAALAHWVYGRAFLEAGSIRAAMVCHALVVVTWRVLLS